MGSIYHHKSTTYMSESTSFIFRFGKAAYGKLLPSQITNIYVRINFIDLLIQKSSIWEAFTIKNYTLVRMARALFDVSVYRHIGMY